MATFGRVKKPTARRLVFQNEGKPPTLDPAIHGYSCRVEYRGRPLRFTDPVSPHHAGAYGGYRHSERNPEATRYVFYLRGHPHPRGIKLPNTDDIHEEFRAGKIPEDLVRGHSAPPDSVPARWSDGKPITAHDFVYSWQRLFDPKTAAPFAQQYTFILHSAGILAGKRPPQDLGVRTLDDWTLEVTLEQTTEFFLTYLDTFTLFAVPRQAIEAAEARGAPASWSEPSHIVTSGPFLLAEWRPYEKVIEHGYREAAGGCAFQR